MSSTTTNFELVPPLNAATATTVKSGAKIPDIVLQTDWGAEGPVKARERRGGMSPS